MSVCDGLEGCLRGESYILVIYDCLGTFSVAPKKHLTSNNSIALCNYNSIALHGGGEWGVVSKKTNATTTNNNNSVSDT